MNTPQPADFLDRLGRAVGQLRYEIDCGAGYDTLEEIAAEISDLVEELGAPQYRPALTDKAKRLLAEKGAT